MTAQRNRAAANRAYLESELLARCPSLAAELERLLDEPCGPGCQAAIMPGIVHRDRVAGGDLVTYWRDRAQSGALATATSTVQYAVDDGVAVIDAEGRRYKIGWHRIIRHTAAREAAGVLHAPVTANENRRQ
jgi:hypothetical protein